MAEKLGITGYFDIDSIIDSFNKIEKKVENFQTTTSTASSIVEKSLQKIATTTDEDTKKRIGNVLSQLQNYLTEIRKELEKEAQALNKESADIYSKANHKQEEIRRSLKGSERESKLKDELKDIIKLYDEVERKKESVGNALASVVGMQKQTAPVATPTVAPAPSPGPASSPTATIDTSSIPANTLAENVIKQINEAREQAHLLGEDISKAIEAFADTKANASLAEIKTKQAEINEQIRAQENALNRVKQLTDGMNAGGNLKETGATAIEGLSKELEKLEENYRKAFAAGNSEETTSLLEKISDKREQIEQIKGVIEQYAQIIPEVESKIAQAEDIKNGLGFNADVSSDDEIATKQIDEMIGKSLQLREVLGSALDGLTADDFRQGAEASAQKMEELKQKASEYSEITQIASRAINQAYAQQQTDISNLIAKIAELKQKRDEAKNAEDTEAYDSYNAQLKAEEENLIRANEQLAIYADRKAQIDELAQNAASAEENTNNFAELPEQIAAAMLSAEEWIAKNEEARQKFEEVKEAFIESNQQLQDSIDNDSLSDSEVIAALEKLKSEAADYADVAEDYARKASGAYKEQEKYVDSLRERLNELNEQLEEVRENGTTEELETLKKKLNEVNQQLQDESNTLSSLEEEMDDAIMKAVEASEAEDQIIEGLDRINSSAGDSGEEIVSFWDKFKNGVTGAKDATIDFATGHGKAKEAIGDFKKELEKLPGGMGKIISSFGGMTKAALKFIATPIGAVIGAIVFALKAFSTWLNKSSEGQKVLGKITAAVDKILEKFTEMLVKVGEYLFKAFTEPQGALYDFGQNFISTFKSVVQAASDSASAIWHFMQGIWEALNFNWDEASDKFSQAWDDAKSAAGAYVETVKGSLKTGFSLMKGAVKVVGDAYDKRGSIKDWFNSSISDVATAFEKGDTVKNTKSDRTKVNDAGLAKDKQIAEKRGEVETAEGEERKKAVQELNDMLNKRYDDEIKAQQKVIKALEEKHNLNIKDKKVEDEIKQEKEKLAELEKKQAQARTQAIKFVSQETRKQEIAARKAEREAEQAQKKAEREKEKARKAAERDRKKQETEARKAEKVAEQAQKKAENERKKANKAWEREQAKKLATTKKVAEAVADYNETVRTNNISRAERDRDLKADIESAKIASIEDGAEKLIKQRSKQRKDELDAIASRYEKAVEEEIQAQEEEYKKAYKIRIENGEKGVEPWSIDMVDSSKIQEIADQFSELYELTEQRQQKDISKEWVEKYKDSAQQRLDIEKKFNEDIAIMEKDRADAETRNDQKTVDALTGAIAEAQKNKAKELLNFDFSKLKESKNYVRAFEDLNNTSTETLEALIKEFERVKASAAANLTPTELREYTKTIKELQDVVDSRENIFTRMTKDTEGYRKATTKLNSAKSTLDKVKEGQSVFKGWTFVNGKLEASFYTLKEAQDEYNEALDEQHKASNKVKKDFNELLDMYAALSNAIKSVGDQLGGTAGQIMGFISDVISFSTSTMKTLGAITNEIADKMHAVEKASVVLTLIAGALKIFNTFSKFFSTSDDLYEKYAKKQREINKLTDAVNEYRLAVLKAQNADSHWLATDNLTSLRDAYKENQEVLNSYYAKLTEAQEKYRNKSSGLSKAALPLAVAGLAVASVFTAGAAGAIGGAILGAVSSAAAASAGTFAAAALGGIAAGLGGALVGKAVQSGIDNVQYKKGQVAAYDNLRIQTRHKTFFRSEKTADLRQWVKENLGADLFDENGLINLKAAQTVLDKYGDKLVGETKETLEELMKLREEYDEFLEQLHDYVSDMFSPLLDNMTDAIWAWLSEGEDALDKFKEYASDTFADIAKEAIRNFYNITILNKFQEELEELYKQYAAGNISEEDLMRQVAQIAGRVGEQFETSLPTAERLATLIDEEFKKHGIDITGNTYKEDQSATSSSAEKITYDQAETLIGIVTAQQIAIEQGNMQRLQIAEVQTELTQNVVNLSTYTAQISDQMAVICEYQNSGLQKLDQIILNTNPIGEISSEVVRLRKYIEENL